MKKWIGIALALALLAPCFGVYAADAPPLLRGQEVLELYSFDYANRAYHRVTEATDIAFLTKTLAVFPVSKGIEMAAFVEGARGFLAVFKDGTRLAWYVTSEQLSDDIGVIPATQTVRDKLLNLSDKLNAKYPGAPYPLIYLSKSDVKWINYRDSGDDFNAARHISYASNDPTVIGVLLSSLKALEVKPTPKITKHKPGETIYRPSIGYSWTISIHLDDGTYYELHPRATSLEMWGGREDLLYEAANPATFGALRQTMAQQNLDAAGI